jgi:hypothetical protein
MKKTLLFSGALLALTSSIALAGGVNFAWVDCIGNTGSSHNRNFANCTTTTSTATDAAAGSFILSANMTDFVAVEIVVDVQAEGVVAMPAWWDFLPDPGACHGSSLALTFDMTSFANADGACSDPFGQPATGALANYTVSGNRARIIGVAAIDAGNAQSLSAGLQYYGFRLALKKDKSNTSVAGFCAGCATPVALVLNSLKAVGAALGSAEDNTTPAVSNCITYQSASGTTCNATPALNATWGTIKSLYR